MNPSLTETDIDELFCVSSYNLYDIAIAVFVDPCDPRNFYRCTKVKEDAPVWERAELPVPT